MKTKHILNNSFTWLFLTINSIAIGATIYQMLVLVPEYNRDIPNGMIAFAGSEIRTANFWQSPVYAIASLLSLFSIVLNWKTKRRNWLLLSVGFSVIGAVATYTYFMPLMVNMGLIDHHPTTDLTLLTDSIRKWIFADGVRFWAIIIPAYLLALKAVATPIETTNK